MSDASLSCPQHQTRTLRSACRHFVRSRARLIASRPLTRQPGSRRRPCSSCRTVPDISRRHTHAEVFGMPTLATSHADVRHAEHFAIGSAWQALVGVEFHVDQRPSCSPRAADRCSACRRARGRERCASQRQPKVLPHVLRLDTLTLRQQVGATGHPRHPMDVPQRHWAQLRKPKGGVTCEPLPTTHQANASPPTMRPNATCRQPLICWKKRSCFCAPIQRCW